MENQAGPTSVTWPTYREISRPKIKQRRTCLAFENQPSVTQKLFPLPPLYFFPPFPRRRPWIHASFRAYEIPRFLLSKPYFFIFIVNSSLKENIENWCIERLQGESLERFWWWNDFIKSIHWLIREFDNFDLVLNSKEMIGWLEVNVSWLRILRKNF